MSDVAVETPLGRKTTTAPEQAQFAVADRLLPGGALGGYAIPEALRFVTRRGEGSKLIDNSGNCYLDYVMGAGAMILGHAHPAVGAALHAQVDCGTHYFSILNGPVLELTELVRRIVPCAEMIAYASTGSEATAYALRTARAVTGRQKILKFEGAYHGNHDYSLVSSAPKQRANYPRGQFDTGGVPETMLDHVLVAPYNDLEAVRTIVADNRESLAAIIVEPIQRIIQPEPGFLEGLREIADANGMLLIFDEVVTGFRLAPGGAQEFYGVRPDLAAFGKVLGGGLALGAVAGRRDILEFTDPARKGRSDFAYMNGTLHGNPLASAAGLATLTELAAPGFHAALNDYGARLRAALQERLTRHGLPAVVIGEGSLWHVLFRESAPRNHADVMASDMAALRRFDETLIREGLFVLPTVRRLISAAHDGADFDATVAAFDRACKT